MTKRAIGTIITKNFLAHARTLARSITAHDPEVEVYVLLADRLDDAFDPSAEPFHLIQLSDLGEPDIIERMCFYYTPFELCCALRGYLHEYFYTQTTVDRWFFLDADIMVFRSLDAIFQQLDRASILLTPHLSQFPRSDPFDHEPNFQFDFPLELSVLTAGLYNAGFVGLKRSPEVKAFIAWFKTRLQHYSFDDFALQNWRGLFVDQRWLNLVPFHFENVAIVTDLGANLGHWNLDESALAMDMKGEVTIAHQPIFFVHFSGWDIDKPQLISKHNPRLTGLELPAWAALSLPYREALIANGYETVRHLAYGFATFTTGEPISLAMRQLYHHQVWLETPIEGSPFEQFESFRNCPEVVIHSNASLQEALTRSQQTIQELQTQLSKAQATITPTQAQLSQAQAELAQTHAQLSQAQAELTQTQAQLNQTQTQLDTLQTEHDRVIFEITRLQDYLNEIRNSKLWAVRKGLGRLRRIVSFGRK